MVEEWSSALHQEQEAIERKKGTSAGVERTIPDRVKRLTTTMSSTQPTPHNADSADAKCTAWKDTVILNDQHLEMPEEVAACERQEKYKQQQEKLQKCAEEIKQWTSDHKLQAQADSNRSSTSTMSDNSDPYPSPHGPLSDEDTIKLLIFHDQQMSRIAEYTSLQWSDCPWPILSFAGPKNSSDLVFIAVSA